MAERDQYGNGVGTTVSHHNGLGSSNLKSGGINNPTSTGLGATSDAYVSKRTSRRDQLTKPDIHNVDRSPSRPTSYGAGVFTGPITTGTGRGGTGTVAGGIGRRSTSTGRGGPVSKNYVTTPPGQYHDDFSRNNPGGYSARDIGGDNMMDRSGMGDPRMDRMDRSMDRMDHHRSTSMPAGPMHGRSRSASRGLPGNRGPGFHSLDREGYGERDFMPLREPRERSLDRDFGPGSYGGPYGRRERSLDRRDPMLDQDDVLYGRDMPMRDPILRDPMGRVDPMGRDPMLRDTMGRDPMLRDPLGVRDPMGVRDPTLRSTRLSPNPAPLSLGRGGLAGGDPYLSELQHSNSELQRDLANLKKELELTNQKLGSSMHSIKTFWSPELKKERALRKEESAKYSLINDQLKLLNSENQVSTQ